jgi:hypothetical protein
MQNALELGRIEQDHNLALIYERYVELTKAFEKQYKRAPKCDLFVGSMGLKNTLRSVLTARWEHSDGSQDAQFLSDLYKSFYE